MTDERDELDALAGEYVLGLMGEADTEAFERRLAGDPALRDAVRAARDRFQELDLTAPPSPPPGVLWDRIAAGLDTQTPDGKIVPFRPRPSVLQTVRTATFWKGFAAACVIGAAVATATWQTVLPQKPELIVVLLDTESKPGAIVEAFGDRNIRVVPLASFEVPAGKTLQVWTLPNRETGPVSMGLLRNARATSLTGPMLPPPRPDQLYEITLEPAGGSPTGRPTGHVMAKGFARVPQI